jgi:hypothetical protein
VALFATHAGVVAPNAMPHGLMSFGSCVGAVTEPSDTSGLKE